MDDSRINQIAVELDREISAEGAQAEWRGESLVANKQGLLRLAIELLYAATEPLPPGRELTRRAWNHIWTRSHEASSLTLLSNISRTENVHLETPQPSLSLSQKVGDFIRAAIFIFLIGLWAVSSIIGLYTILKWL